VAGYRQLYEQQSHGQGEEMIRMPPKWAFVLFVSIFMIFGAVFTICGGYIVLKSRQSMEWPSVDGVVKSAEMGFSSGSHAATVTYNYTVNGKLLTGDNIRMMKVYTSDASYAQEDLNNYPVGKKVKVFYSPTDPTDSVLEPGVHPSSWFFLAIGGSSMFWAVVMIGFFKILAVIAARRSAVKNL
jgi:hypothetical protein